MYIYINVFIKLKINTKTRKAGLEPTKRDLEALILPIKLFPH